MFGPAEPGAMRVELGPALARSLAKACDESRLQTPSQVVAQARAPGPPRCAQHAVPGVEALGELVGDLSELGGRQREERDSSRVGPRAAGNAGDELLAATGPLRVQNKGITLIS